MACFKCGQSLDCIVDEGSFTADEKQQIFEYLDTDTSEPDFNGFCHVEVEGTDGTYTLNEQGNFIATPAGQQNCDTMKVAFADGNCKIPHADVGATLCPLSGQALSNFATYHVKMNCDLCKIEAFVDTEKCDHDDCPVEGEPLVSALASPHSSNACVEYTSSGTTRQLKGAISEDEQLGFVSEEMKRAGEPIEGDDEPYCLHADYPCVDSDGEEDNMVHVCHYSSRAGYQTFCIPEADSDILRFYSNSYCGPCEGFNGKTTPGQVI
jgi:hypothetical protein